MSSIDRRVVEMEFDNKQFERGIKETLSSLDALKKGLKLEGATKGLEDISEKGRRFNLNNMASALDNISDKFSVMGAVGFAVIQRLTNAAIDFGKKLTNLVLDPLVAGGKRRALNIEQAKFMFRGLGMDIEEAMANALYAVQGTAFGLDEAAKAASQLGASQVALGDDMRQALRGISGVAAMTNSSYEDTARVFTRVAGQGRVMAVDLNSLAARGLNAAATLADAFGKTEAEIREMVTAGEVSFSMFAEAMDEAFGENATKANETYSGSLSNLRAALSRIGASFYTPHLENMRDLFNALTPAIDSVAEALEPVIDMMVGFSTRGVERLSKAIGRIDFDDVGLVIDPALGIFTNILRIMGEVIKPIRDAFRQIFPPTSMKELGSILSQIEKFVATIKMGAETAENLRRTFAGVFAVFSIGWTVVKELAKFLFNLFGIVLDGSGGFLEATANVGDFLVALDQAIKNGEGLTNFFEGLTRVLTGPIEYVQRLTRALLTLFDFEAPNAERISKGLEPLGRLGTIIVAVWSRIGETLRAVWGVFQPLAERMAPFFRRIGEAITDTFSDLNYSDVLDTLRTGLLGGILMLVNRFVKDFSSGFGSGIHRLTAPFAKMTYTLNTMQNTLRVMTLMQIAIAIGILAASVLALSKVDSAGLTRALSAISVMLTQLVATLYAFTRLGGVTGLMGVGAGLMLFATAIRILTSSVKALSRLEWEDLAKGLSGVTALIGALIVAVRVMSGHTAGMITAGTGLLILATGIRVLVKAVTGLSDLSWEDMARGLVGVGSLLTSLAIFTRLVAVGKAGVLQGAGLLLLATGIRVLATAVGEFAELSWEQIGKGLSTVTGILAAFAIFSQALNPAGLVRAGASLVLIGAAMNILAAAMQHFAKMSWEDIGKGLTTMAGALTAIVLSLNLMPKSTVAKALALVGVATALQMIARALQSMSGMTWEEIGKGLTTLAGSLIIIAAAMLAMKTALPGAAATMVVATALLALTPVLKTLGGMSWEEIIRGLTTLAGVFVIFGLAGIALAPVVPVLFAIGAAVALIGAGLLAAGVGVLAFSVALTALSAASAAGTAAFVAFVAGVVGLIPLVAQQLGIALVIFIEIIASSGPAMIAAMNTLLDAVIQAIITNAPKIIDLFSDMVLMLLEKLVDIIPKMTNAALLIMIGILQALNDHSPTIVREMVNLVVSMLNELAAGMPRFVRAGTNLMVEFLRGIRDNVGRIITAGADIIIAFIQGISENMVRIADEGMKAVIGFVNGVADSIRANTPELRAAGGNLASAIIEGLTGGLTGAVGRVAESARNLAKSALDGAKNFLGIRSPSKEFEKVGVWVSEGFANGLIGTRDQVVSAWTGTTDLLQRAMDTSAQQVLRLEGQLEKLKAAKDRDVEAIRKTEVALAQARREYDASNSAMTQMNEKLVGQRTELERLGDQYDLYSQKLREADQQLKDAIKTRNDYSRSIENQYSSLPTIGEETGLEDYINDLTKANDDLVRFSSVLQELRRQGLADDLYEEFLAKGPSILPFVEELLAGGAESIEVVNNLSSDLAKQASRLGRTASRELYQAGVKTARGLVRGLNSQKKAVEAEMEAIAKSIIKVLELQLKIKSPSRVMEQYGKFTGEGLASGIRKSLPAVERATEGMGKEALDTMKDTISNMTDIFMSDMDLNPTITPVLDLSELRRDSTLIDSMMSARRIDIDRISAKAQAASFKYEANELAKRLSKIAPEREGEGASVIFNQYNTSPKALSSGEIYRNTKNQLSVAKGALTPNAAQETEGNK